MTITLIAFAGFVAVCILGYCALVASVRPDPADIAMLRREIERRERQHRPRKDLRKQYVEAKRKELANG